MTRPRDACPPARSLTLPQPPAARDQFEEQRMPPTATRERSVSCHYDPELTAARKARAHVCRTLSSWGLGDHADVAELIISELVANAVGHGEGPVMTRISYDGRYLHLEVHDDGPGRPVWHLAGTWDESGRGLTVIAGLIGAWGSTDVTDDVAGDGKTVHVAICVEKPMEFSGVRADAKDASV
jgi:hypothetical protein